MILRRALLALAVVCGFTGAAAAGIIGGGGIIGPGQGGQQVRSFNSTLSLTGGVLGINYAHPGTYTASQAFNGGLSAAAGAFTVDGSGNVVAAGLATSGDLALNGSATITSPPPTAGVNSGWKFGLYSTSYAMGIAANTWANLIATNQWFSIFETLPANDAAMSTPDTHAVFSINGGGAVVMTSLAGTGSRPLCGTSTGNIEAGSLSGGLVTCP